MARPRRRRLPVEDEGLNLTPLLDVIFNLIFFFVVATTIRTQETFFDLTLPHATEGEATRQPEKLPEVFVARDGALALNGEAIEAAQLTERLKSLLQENQDQRVVFSADAQATVQQSVDAMDLIRAAGVSEVIQRVEKRSP
jgi:biopolymer transport protein ExbD